MIVLIMGVTGAGKTTVGSLLAAQMGWVFADADSFHPPANVEKMRQAIPLTDADRVPWLQAIHQQMVQWTAAGTNGVITCSALKQSYRERLLQGLTLKLVYLKGSYELIASRVSHRVGHFAPAQLVASQFQDLEEPENALVVQVDGSPEEIAAEIRCRLGIA
jgi:gluconokinase